MCLVQLSLTPSKSVQNETNTRKLQSSQNNLRASLAAVKAQKILSRKSMLAPLPTPVMAGGAAVAGAAAGAGAAAAVVAPKAKVKVWGNLRIP